MKRQTINPRYKFLPILLVIAIVSVWLYKLPGNEQKNSDYNVSELINAREYFDLELYAKGEADVKDFGLDKKAVGAVIPHHMLASSLISSLMKSLAGGDYDTVFIIGPNHGELGGAFAITSKSSYQTEFGTAETDTEAVERMLKIKAVANDDDVIKGEHSVLVPVNYIENFFPEVKVVAIILKETNDLSDIYSLAEELSGVIGENDLILASVDFSHNLDAISAAENDNETLEAIKNSNYELINSYRSEHLDSSSSLLLLDLLVKKKHNSKFNLLLNSSSNVITGSKTDVTSYILGVYYKK